MRRTLHGIAVLVLGFLVVPGFAADKKKDIDKKHNGLVPAGRLTGRVVSVEESKRALRVNIGQRTINPVAAAALATAQKAMRSARTKQDRIAAIGQLQAAAKDLYVNDVELTATDDVVVRVAQPPANFDEKGKIKKYTKKELRELKGDPKLPGYQGEFSNLRQNQIVQISLVKRKEAAMAARARDADNSLAADNLPMMAMIIVIAEPAN